MSEDWQEAGSMSNFVRWTKEPVNDKEKEGTIYIGDVVEGTLVDRKDNVGKNESTFFSIKTKEHGKVNVWANIVLLEKFEEAGIGSVVRVENLGIQKPKTATGREYRGFKLHFREAPMKEAGASTGVDAQDSLPEAAELPDM